MYDLSAAVTRLARFLTRPWRDVPARPVPINDEEARLRLVADNIPNLAWMAEPDGAIYWYNQRWHDYAGTTPDQMKGWGWQAVHDPALIDGITERFKRCIRDETPWEDIFPLRSAAGEWRWFLSRAVPVRDEAGRLVRWFGTNTDITEQHAAEGRLIQSEARFRTAMDAVRGTLWTNTADGRMEGDQPGWTALTGQPKEAFAGHGWIDAVHPTDAQPTIDAWHLAVEERRVFEFEHRLKTADGEWNIFAIRAVPILDANGEISEWVGVHTEVTAQRRAETAMRESEARFRLMADTAPSPVWMTNAEGEVEFVNAALVTSFGRPADELVGHVWKQAIHPDDRAGVESAMAAARPQYLPYGFEARFMHADGRWRWMRISVNPRFDEAKRFLGYVGMAFDVTDIRETTADLAAAAAERDAILGQLAEGVIVTDPDGQITFVNDAAVRLHGVERLDVGPEDYSEAYQLFTEDGRPYPPHELPLARAVRNGETVLDARWRIRRPDGSEVIAVGNARPVFNPDGSRIGAVLTLRDETARVEAENRLAESETRFRTIANIAPVQIWMTEDQGEIAFANSSYKTFFDVDDDALASSWRESVATLKLEAEHQAFVRAAQGRERYQRTMLMQHPRLGTRWLRCEGIPRFDAAGVFQGYVGANLDVTDIKRAEQDLKRINELLEERVGEALAEKAKAEADLMHAQRMEAVGRLTGGVAHDFNNLLTVVIGALDIMLRSPNDAAKRQKLGEAALAAARRGEGLTHQLLAFSRRQALRPEAIDLNVQIRESEPLLRRAVGEAVEFKLKLRRGGARVNVDPSQFEAALLNLVVNARDAVGNKGRVTVQTLSCTVEAGEVTELAAGDYVCVTVADDGVGMAPEVIARVFEPFFTTKAVGKGTGLGLSQVYGFARQSGGAAQISSTVGHGTEIKLFLPPRDEAADVAADAVPEPARPMAAGRRLLLVEDDVSVAAVALELLEGLGLEVRSVETAPQALNLLKQERFDMMLSDVVMPGGMTGIELARMCGRDYPDMRVVLTSGYAGEDVDAALADAPWPFLRKPYSGDQLARVLGELA